MKKIEKVVWRIVKWSDKGWIKDVLIRRRRFILFLLRSINILDHLL